MELPNEARGARVGTTEQGCGHLVLAFALTDLRCGHRVLAFTQIDPVIQSCTAMTFVEKADKKAALPGPEQVFVSWWCCIIGLLTPNLALSVEIFEKQRQL